MPSPVSSPPSWLSVVGSWTGLWGPEPPPVFQVNGSLLVAPPFPPSGPGEPGSPSSLVLQRRYDFPLALTWFLMVSVTGPTRASYIRFRRSAPDDPGESWSGPEHLISRRPNTRHDAPVGACGISQVSWRPILCLCPAPRPRPSRQDLAFSGLADTAPGLPKPKASAGT